MYHANGSKKNRQQHGEMEVKMSSLRQADGLSV
jgi:hypothetical protein